MTASPALAETQPKGTNKTESLESLQDRTKALIEQKNLGEALALEQKATTLYPSSPRPHSGMSGIYLQLGDVNKAEAEAKMAVKLGSKDAPAHYNLGIVYMMTKRIELAMKELKTSIALEPKFIPAHLAYSQCIFATGKPREGIGYLEATAKANPKDANLWLYLASAYTSIGDINGAQEAAAKAVAIDPQSPSVRRFIIDMNLNSGRVTEATAAARSLLKENPTRPLAYALLIRCYFVGENGAPEIAKVIEQAKQNIPKEELFFFEVGNECYKHSKSKREQPQKQAWINCALTAFEAAAAANPNNIDYHMRLLLLYEEKGNLNQARHQLQILEKLAPQDERIQKAKLAMKNYGNDFASSIGEWFQSLINGWFPKK
jgi:Flp pilus assembly protein TadD